jgi:hypothetical protein
MLEFQPELCAHFVRTLFAPAFLCARKVHKSKGDEDSAVRFSSFFLVTSLPKRVPFLLGYTLFFSDEK